MTAAYEVVAKNGRLGVTALAKSTAHPRFVRNIGKESGKGEEWINSVRLEEPSETKLVRAER